MKAMIPGMDSAGLDNHGKSGTKKLAAQSLGQDAVPLTFANLLQAASLAGQPKGLSGKQSDHSGGQARIATHVSPLAVALVQTGSAKVGLSGHPNKPAPILRDDTVKPGKPETQAMTEPHRPRPSDMAVHISEPDKSTSVHPPVSLRMPGEPILPVQEEAAQRLAGGPISSATKAVTDKVRGGVSEEPVNDGLPQGTVQRSKLVFPPMAVTPAQSEATANLAGATKTGHVFAQHAVGKPEQAALKQVADVSLTPVKETDLPASPATGIPFAAHHLTAHADIRIPTTDAQQTTANVSTHTLSMSHPNPSQALSDIVLGQIQAGQDQVKVKIHPQGMGSIVVAVTKHVDGGIQLQVVANQMATMQWLAAQSNQIADAVRSSGVAVSGVQVSFGRTDLGGSNNTGGQSSRRHRHGQAAPHGVAIADGPPGNGWSRPQDYLDWRKGAISIQV